MLRLVRPAALSLARPRPRSALLDELEFAFSEVAFAFRVTPAGMLAGLIFAGMLGLVGGFLPALRAGRQPLAASLRAA